MEGRGQAQIQTTAVAQRGLPMITALELGPVRESDPCRPSLILCRPGGRSLWELAKASGSDVDSIRAVNGMEEEDDDDRMLLIPVS